MVLKQHFNTKKQKIRELRRVYKFCVEPHLVKVFWLEEKVDSKRKVCHYCEEFVKDCFCSDSDDISSFGRKYIYEPKTISNPVFIGLGRKSAFEIT